MVTDNVNFSCHRTRLKLTCSTCHGITLFRGGCGVNFKITLFLITCVRKAPSNAGSSWTFSTCFSHLIGGRSCGPKHILEKPF